MKIARPLQGLPTALEVASRVEAWTPIAKKVQDNGEEQLVDGQELEEHPLNPVIVEHQQANIVKEGQALVHNGGI